jgi:tripartite-type tricarboxylate transporter receptor subunit TctC
MELPRRRFLHLAGGTAACCRIFEPCSGAGLSKPTGALCCCILCRQSIGHSRAIDSGGNLATDIVVRASSDGYTLLEATSANVWNAALYDTLNFDFSRDIAPVASISRTPAVLTVTPSFPAETVPEFISYARANPGKINMASGGIGSLPHVAGELFKFMTGINLVHVPYRGSYLPDLLGGQVQITFGPIPTLIEQIRAGKLRALAVTGAEHHC